MAEVFGARYIFNADGESMVVETEEEYEVRTAAGWKESPKEFGIETHPSVTTQPVMAPVMPPAQPPSADLSEVLRLMVSYQHQQEATEATLEALTVRVVTLEAAAVHTSVQATGEAHGGEGEPTTRRGRSS